MIVLTLRQTRVITMQAKDLIRLPEARALVIHLSLSSACGLYGVSYGEFLDNFFMELIVTFIC